jgi:23S rRNA pseudouridine2604 synthase
MRINKYLAHMGIASRRAIDTLVSAGKILVNNKIATPGYKLNPGDIISVQGKTLKFNPAEGSSEHIYIALYKPAGISSTCAEDDPDNIISYLRSGSLRQSEALLAKICHLPRVYPVGRLDKYSEGLIILTNDGELTQTLTHPSFEHEKEYLVVVDKPLTNEFLKQFASGIEIELEDGELATTNPCAVAKVSSHSFKTILKQGLNRQIRRMVEALDNKVLVLTRLRIAKLELGKLKAGDYKLVNSDDII